MSWYLLIHHFSLLFLKNGSFAGKTCSMIVQVISDVLWPGWVKCSPVGLFVSLLLAYPLCSPALKENFLCVSPMYINLGCFLQVIR